MVIFCKGLAGTSASQFPFDIIYLLNSTKADYVDSQASKLQNIKSTCRKRLLQGKGLKGTRQSPFAPWPPTGNSDGHSKFSHSSPTFHEKSALKSGTQHSPPSHQSLKQKSRPAEDYDSSRSDPQQRSSPSAVPSTDSLT